MSNLLIVGAGAYSLVVFEIAKGMGCFEKISFIDDNKLMTDNHIPVIGTSADLGALQKEYDSIVVAVGNNDFRFDMLNKIKENYSYKIATLISPNAYVSPLAVVKEGTIIEPMAVVHPLAVVKRGCIISAGSVVNHNCVLGKCVHVDCLGAVNGYSIVPEKTKIKSGQVFDLR